MPLQCHRRCHARDRDPSAAMLDQVGSRATGGPGADIHRMPQCDCNVDDNAGSEVELGMTLRSGSHRETSLLARQ